MKILVICALTAAATGCYQSGSRQQDDWDGGVDLFEPAPDLTRDDPEIEPDMEIELPPDPVCGNEIVEEGEECDEGEGNSNTEPDACRTSCTEAACGDGVMDTGEECDDGDVNSDTEPDACRTDCDSACCGDGVRDSGEECDTADLGGETCVSQGHVGGTLLCGALCRLDASRCFDPECGNGACDLGETEINCPADCPDGCGNGTCQETEDQFNCPADCGAVAVSAGFLNTCAVLADGTARCWGINGEFQLGDGIADHPECELLTLYSTEDCSNVPVAVSGPSGVMAISTKYGHTCAALYDGTARCWGWNEFGQIGNGTRTVSSVSVPTAVSGIGGVIDVSVGWGHSCALLSDGTARCWGANARCQLGDGTTNDRLVPVAVSGLSEAVAISAGWSHSCAVLSDGTAMCWGQNSFGQLGDGTDTFTMVPAAVAGLSGIVAIAPGGYYTCALLSDGTSWCWGAGPLGDDTITNSFVPVAVHDLTGAVALSAGSHHACAVRSDGTAMCWGGVALGNDSPLPSRVPVAVMGLTEAVAVSAGYGDCSVPTEGCFILEHTCALLLSGTAMCWGGNDGGQLGNGTTAYGPVPVPVAPW